MASQLETNFQIASSKLMLIQQIFQMDLYTKLNTETPPPMPLILLLFSVSVLHLYYSYRYFGFEHKQKTMNQISQIFYTNFNLQTHLDKTKHEFPCNWEDILSMLLSGQTSQSVDKNSSFNDECHVVPFRNYICARNRPFETFTLLQF